MSANSPSTPSGPIVGRMMIDGRPRYIATLTEESSHGVTLKITEIGSWECDETHTPCGPFEEVALFFVKWDGCAHVGFRDPDLDNEWAHVCGVNNMRRTIKMMAWAWDLCCDLLKAKGFDIEHIESNPQRADSAAGGAGKLPLKGAGNE